MLHRNILIRVYTAGAVEGIKMVPWDMGVVSGNMSFSPRIRLECLAWKFDVA